MGVDYTDNEATDGDRPYVLFPRNNETNGGYRRNPGATPAVYDTNKYVTPANAYSFLTNLKAAALVLNHTHAVIAGTQLDGFDTHRSQGGPTGSQANLLRQVAWGIYALHKYFTTQPGQVTWDNLLIVTLSEFGRTTVMNADLGSDHAEAGVMFIAGGSVKGYGTGGFNGTGVYGCSPADALPWLEGPAGSMFGASRRYLKRAYDYRQVLGRIIRNHLGASQSQLDTIIPGYQDPNEKLLAGGASGIDGVEIMAEPPFI
jgi:uncharacterized protein (DUF1501 family)